MHSLPVHQIEARPKYRFRAEGWYAIKLSAGGSGSVTGSWKTDKCNGKNDFEGEPVCLKVEITGAVSIGGGLEASLQRKSSNGRYNTIFSGSVGVFGTGQGTISAKRCYDPKNGWGPIRVCSSLETSVTANLLLMNIKIPGPEIKSCADF